jgi:hypothetical protein
VPRPQRSARRIGQKRVGDLRRIVACLHAGTVAFAWLHVACIVACCIVACGTASSHRCMLHALFHVVSLHAVRHRRIVACCMRYGSVAWLHVACIVACCMRYGSITAIQVEEVVIENRVAIANAVHIDHLRKQARAVARAGRGPLRSGHCTHAHPNMRAHAHARLGRCGHRSARR